MSWMTAEPEGRVNSPKRALSDDKPKGSPADNVNECRKLIAAK